MIDVLVPVLNRPQNAQPLVDSFRAVSQGEIHFICSPGDEEEIEACRATGENVLIVDWEPGPADYAKKMNYGYRHTENPLIFLGADDITFSPGWQMKAMAAMEENCVVATNDQANAQVKRGQFGTHCLVSRGYVDDPGASADGPGVLIHEGYDHNFVDRELCHLAQSRGLYAFAQDSIVAHRHPLWRTARWDSTYRKGVENFHQDRELFLKRAALWNYVGLHASERMVAARRRRDITRAR